MPPRRWRGAWRVGDHIAVVTETKRQWCLFFAPQHGCGAIPVLPLVHMSEPERYDETADDHERFEVELLAQDRDARSPSTADLDDETAHQMVRELLDAETVTPVVDQRILVHKPSGTAFESMLQLAVFHEGWTAAHDADGTSE